MRGINRRLQDWLQLFGQDGVPRAGVITPDALSALQDLLHEVERERAKGLFDRAETQLQPELAAYRSGLQSAQQLLQRFAIHLRVEQARLGDSRGQLHSSSEWVQAHRLTER
jgi:hypothetical protein